jgi:hypothetical protein
VPPLGEDAMGRAASSQDQSAGASAVRELRGIVERITYQNPENGYTVARLAVKHSAPEVEPAWRHDRLVTIVGTLADLTPGEAIIARGWWRNDAKHGWQFMAIDYQTTLPATLQGMKKYLGSGLVKGIGPVNAGRIVDAFGEATFDDSLASLRPRGHMVLFGAASGRVPPFDPMRLEDGGSLFLTRPSLRHYTARRGELLERAAEVFGWIAQDKLRVHIGGRYPLEDVRKAHEDLTARRTSGKLLVLPG